ncbi:MAG: type II toxin-antitoxin system VapC family toxin [Burkholderiaceae bacterium]|jgi:predicted nucleic acid-binding protein|nr:type II toxin-antitoxin system VapC family toxin [Burkholderiaceae bacterium]
MHVVDTNVVAYLLIAGDRTEQAQALWRADRDWRSDAFLRVEFSNLLATQLRAKALTLAEAVSLLDRAGSSVQSMAEVSHADALRTAAAFGVSAYDARFLAVAQALGTKLVTEDARLRKAAPALTQSLAQALAA